MDASLYRQHVQYVLKQLEQLWDSCGIDKLVLHSGCHHYYFGDDQYAPFRTNPNFAYFVPISGPGHCLVIRPGEQPKLIWYSPDDYWYEPTKLVESYWQNEFEMICVSNVDDLPKHVGEVGKAAFVGEDVAFAETCGFAAPQVNPDNVVNGLHWIRSYKSDYEILCIEQANDIAAKAHYAARQVFENHGSELDIHHAYVQAAGGIDAELPYESIVALNQKGSFLHYVNKRRSVSGDVLLLDSGATHAGYASDITRTWTAPSVDDGFRAMLQDFNALELALCDAVKPDLSFVDLHVQAHQLIAELLANYQIVNVSGQEAFDRGLTRIFFPHGLGHFLGIQVHDVAGRQENISGGAKAPPTEYPFLRTTRILEPTMVVTIEPGVYFIDSLLRPQRTGTNAKAFNWERIDTWRKYGGMRIEDDVLVTDGGHRNLTRPYHPE